jgi:MoaA/NifB/PqqE/SkfB family radical SAM enzyme
MMNQKLEFQAHVDEQGMLVIPAGIASRHGLKPGAQVYLEEGPHGLQVRNPISHLAKIYIEPTNGCNLGCRTCIRNSWEESVGRMSQTMFRRIIEGLGEFSPPPKIFFGGFGEPLSHPGIVEMVAEAKALGSCVELITNGTLLTEEKSRQLIDAGLDMLWVSLDGATPESYTDVRRGAVLPEVLVRLRTFSEARKGPPFAYYFFPHDPSIHPRIGIVFVAMRRNIAELPSVFRLGNQVGATQFLVTNVLPYTVDLCKEVLYSRALSDLAFLPSLYQMDLPNIDMDKDTMEPLFWTMRSGHTLSLAGAAPGVSKNRCPFIDQGATAVAWDGNISPCLPLLHNHVTYMNDQERTSRRHVIGNLSDRDLSELWNDPGYTALRDRVQRFDFSPCVFCGGCELSERNEEDCFGSAFPTCGGCLWAQGMIRCP